MPFFPPFIEFFLFKFQLAKKTLESQARSKPTAQDSMTATTPARLDHIPAGRQTGCSRA
jgi:hypothetical protein